MGKIMINGEQYPSFVVKTGLDDSSIVKDKTWSSSKINEELEDVRGELDIIVEEANKNTTINDEATSLTTTWSSSKIASELGAKAHTQSFNRPSTYNKPDLPYLKISRYGGLPFVQYYTCETYIINSHAGNVGILNFIRNDNGVKCVYHDVVGSSLKLTVEKYNEYTCWLKYSGTESEMFTVYSLNGYKPTAEAVASTA